MDLIRIVYHLRPDVTWRNELVNGFSIETIKETYQSSQPFPTITEISEAWETLQLLDDAEKIRDEEIAQAQVDAGINTFTVEQANNYISSVIDLTEFDNATTFAETKAAIRNIIVGFVKVIRKIIPYLLKIKK